MPAQTVRPPAVAGTFYPASPEALQDAVDGHLAAAARRGDFADDEASAKAVIAPHAGYVYSGPVAGSAFVQLASVRDSIERVVLLGPAHRVALRGLAHPDVAFCETPLGRVEVDGEAIEALAESPSVSADAYAHSREHSLEVEMPFLQTVLDGFKLVPLVVGDASPEEVADVLLRVWGGDETAIVISSDLSHYLTYDEAMERDRRTADKIVDLEPKLSPYDACGARPVNGLLVAAREKGLDPRLLDLRNSGDTAGGREQVVGYGAFSFLSQP